ncbi:hypothetical protein [Streptomyces asiaticus]|uniref:hypothetical protein n=1 Tax=Streptomyces asiaticus TaxID=114695 RepID=UPI001BA6AAD1|nr:hypothetical protein [Streptomyces asiaticus]
MPKRPHRKRIVHKRVAVAARANPRRWLLAGTYRTHSTAQGMAYTVRTGRYGPYAEGGFEAVARDLGDETGLYVRYVGGAA